MELFIIHRRSAQKLSTSFKVHITSTTHYVEGSMDMDSTAKGHYNY